MKLDFEVSDQDIETLDSLVKEAGLDSYKDLFNNSLALFRWAAEQTKAGCVIAAVDEEAKKYTEVQMQALSHLAPKKEVKDSVAE
jgi:hypothetical protein